jgi:hypothetical protein
MVSKKLIVLLGAFLLPGLILIALTRGTVGSLKPAAASDLNLQLPQPQTSQDIAAPNISAISSPSATCSRPTPGSGACYIQWDYLYVTAASSSYVISMTVSINNQIRAYHSGFFQTYMYIPSDMTANGYQVVCGFPQNSAGFGNSYSYTIRARDSSGLTAANYGSVTCPSDIARLYLPLIQNN